jgi:hypothetical protein
MDWVDVDLQEASYAGGYRVHVRYNNALEADVDFSDMLNHPFYAPLKDIKLFSQVTVDEEVRVLQWPGDIDMAPEITFERAVQAAGKSV